MFDIDALVADGFKRVFDTEAAWQEYQEKLNAQLNDPLNADPGNRVTVNYMLERGNLRITTQQNTRVDSMTGIDTVIRYPEIVVIEALDGRRVTCAPDMDLINALVEQLAGAAPLPDTENETMKSFLKAAPPSAPFGG